MDDGGAESDNKQDEDILTFEPEDDNKFARSHYLTLLSLSHTLIHTHTHFLLSTLYVNCALYVCDNSI